MKLRKWSEVLVLVLFFVVPFLDLFRIDILSGHYYWLTLRFAFAQALPLLLTILLLVFVVIGLNFFKPRMFCSHFCPHNTTSQWMRTLVAYKLDIPVAILVTPAIAFTLMSYFVDPGKLFDAIISFDPPFMAGFFVATCVFIGALVIKLRSKFCANICPYGFFQQLITPEKTSFGKKFAVSLVMMVLAGGMVASAVMTPGTEISLGTGARMKTGPETMTYTYNLTLVNNQGIDETFNVRFPKLHPVGREFDAPITLKPGEEKVLPFAFQAAKDEQVQLTVCTEKEARCKDFSFTLAGQ